MSYWHCGGWTSEDADPGLRHWDCGLPIFVVDFSETLLWHRRSKNFPSSQLVRSPYGLATSHKRGANGAGAQSAGGDATPCEQTSSATPPYMHSLRLLTTPANVRLRERGDGRRVFTAEAGISRSRSSFLLSTLSCACLDEKWERVPARTITH